MSKQEDLLKLAETGGNDASLFLLDKIHELEDKIESIGKELEKDPPEDVRVERISMKLASKLSVMEKGESGTDGKDGIDGKDGTDGKNGLDGKDGKDGKDGNDGKDGEDGIDGKDGKDGSPDTPEQVRDKLETLKDADRLDVSAIKGLDEKLKSIEVGSRSIFGGGKTRFYKVNLSSQLDGSTKRFFIGTHFGIDSVNSSSAPFGAFIEDTDYTEDGKYIQFTSAVDAPSALAAGQSLIVKVLK